MIRRLLTPLLLLFVLVSFIAPISVGAEDVFTEVCSSGSGGDSSVCQSQVVTSDPVSGTGGVINRVTRLIAYAAGAIAVIVIIISGIRFATSHGDPQSVNNAKNTILYAVIGLMVIIIAQSIIIYVVNEIYK